MSSARYTSRGAEMDGHWYSPQWQNPVVVLISSTGSCRNVCCPCGARERGQQLRGAGGRAGVGSRRQQ